MTIFVAKISGTDLHRLGLTKTSPADAIAELQRTLPFEVELVWAGPGGGALLAWARERLQAFRVKGDGWFKVMVPEVLDLLICALGDVEAVLCRRCGKKQFIPSKERWCRVCGPGPEHVLESLSIWYVTSARSFAASPSSGRPRKEQPPPPPPAEKPKTTKKRALADVIPIDRKRS